MKLAFTCSSIYGYNGKLHIPRVTIKKRKDIPWMTPNLKRAMSKRNHYNRLYKQSGCRSAYSRVRNKVTAMFRQAKRVYFQDVNHCNNKKFWKIVKRLTKCRSAIPSLQVDDTVTAHTDSEKANLLNNFFTSCFNTLAPPL